MKKELFVRFANEGTYQKKVSLDINKIENPTPFSKEVFFTIDGVRVAVMKEEWEQLQKEIKKT